MAKRKEKPGKKQLDALMNFKPNMSVWRVGVGSAYQRENLSKPATEYYPRFNQSKQWAVVIAACRQLSFEVAEVLEYCEAIPEDIGYVACLTPYDFKEKEVAWKELKDAGVQILFDGENALDGTSIVDNKDLNYDDVRAHIASPSNFQWYGKVPDAYIEYKIAEAENTSYQLEEWNFERDLCDFGIGDYVSAGRAIYVLSQASYGFVPEIDLDLPRPKAPVVKCNFEVDEGYYEKKYRAILKPYLDVALIWTSILRNFGVSLNEAIFCEDVGFDGLLDLGRMLGVENTLKACFEEKIPAEDLVA